MHKFTLYLCRYHFVTQYAALLYTHTNISDALSAFSSTLNECIYPYIYFKYLRRLTPPSYLFFIFAIVYIRFIITNYYKIVQASRYRYLIFFILIQRAKVFIGVQVTHHLISISPAPWHVKRFIPIHIVQLCVHTLSSKKNKS